MGRVWDAISDPFAGYLTTKTNTRWGRLRPWVAGSIVPLSCAYTALWCVPDWEPNWKIVYVTVCYFTYQTCISTYHVPYTALTMHLSNVPAERDAATIFRLVA